MARKKRVTPKSRSITDVDQRVAANIRRLRLERCMSQERIGTGVGVTFQQMQKYETGKNRITIGRLVAICDALDVSLDEDHEIDPGLADRFRAAPIPGAVQI